jgi:hypothetical protein
VAADLGIDLAELAEITGVMADAGITSSMAGTVMRRALINLTSASGAAKTTLEDLNVRVFDQEGAFRGILPVVKDLRKATRALTDEQRAHAMKAIFGARAISGMNALLNTSSEELEAMIEAVKSADGTMDDMFKNMEEGVQFQLTRLKETLRAVKIEIGSELAPTVKDFTQNIIDHKDALKDWGSGLMQVMFWIGDFTMFIVDQYRAFGKAWDYMIEKHHQLWELRELGLKEALKRIKVMEAEGKVDKWLAGLWEIEKEKLDALIDTKEELREKIIELNLLSGEQVEAFKEGMLTQEEYNAVLKEMVETYPELFKAEYLEMLMKRHLTDETEKHNKAIGETIDGMEEIIRLNNKLTSKGYSASFLTSVFDPSKKAIGGGIGIQFVSGGPNIGDIVTDKETGGSRTWTGTEWGDFISRPGQPLQNFSPDDTIVGVKSTASLGGVTVNIENVYGVNAEDIAEALNEKLKPLIAY